MDGFSRSPRQTARLRRTRRIFPAKAKRAIYIHMAESPSHLDLFDPKPKLKELNGQPCPDELYKRSA